MSQAKCQDLPLADKWRSFIHSSRGILSGRQQHLFSANWVSSAAVSAAGLQTKLVCIKTACHPFIKVTLHFCMKALAESICIGPVQMTVDLSARCLSYMPKFSNISTALAGAFASTSFSFCRVFCSRSALSWNSSCAVGGTIKRILCF